MGLGIDLSHYYIFNLFGREKAIINFSQYFSHMAGQKELKAKRIYKQASSILQTFTEDHG